MRIGIDCRSILGPGKTESAGIGHYVHNLVAALVEEDARNEYVLFFDSSHTAEAKKSLHVNRPNVTARVIPFRSLSKIPFAYSHMVVAAVFAREHLDILHGPANVVPLFCRRPWVVTVHDFANYDHPDWFPAGTFGTWDFSKKILVPHSVRKAARVIAVSQATARDTVRLFEIDEGKIDVVYEGAWIGTPAGGPAGHPYPRTFKRPTSATGRQALPPASSTRTADAAAVLARYGIGNRTYLLSLGTIEPRKNLPTAVRAFVEAVKSGGVPAEVHYVIAGGRGWKEGPILEEIEAADKEIGGNGRIRWIGYLPHEDKHAVLSSAAALVFPSFQEGFGLPVAEAMAAGVPVMGSDIETTREVIGNEGWLAAPTDVGGFALAMAAVLRGGTAVDERVARAAERVAQFNWQRAARETIRSYERAYEAGE